jgi:LDH2 family malate/lactate/ureidoglycolate dehydrogenase
MAEHKGYVIAMMMDVLSGVLTGSKFGAAVNGPYQFDKRSGCGQLMIAMNVEAFQPPAQFNQRMEELIRETKAVPRAQGCEEVFYPGELEAINDRKHRNDGISFPDDTIADLRTIAASKGLEAELPF